MTRRLSVLRLLPAALLPALLGGGLLAALQRGADGFPHAVHERLFPVCEGCHSGIVSGVSAETYPQPADCALCHDGVRAAEVAWQARTARPSNLRFSHGRHLTATARAGERASCISCHAAGRAPSRMEVDAAAPALCLRCHAHTADEHLAPTLDCSRCHVPLTGAPDIPVSRVSRFPRPDWHDAAEYLSTHGPTAATSEPAGALCAVCHARETCERCHANAASVAAIVALAPDPRVAELEAGRKPEYPVPASHADRQWAAEHGSGARADAGSCANCHTRTNCSACHGAGAGAATALIGTLPVPVPGGATGVGTAASARAVHTLDIKARHGSLAATGRMECAQCHSSQECAACHAGSDSRSFHPLNFAQRHASDVFAGSGDCQSCHNTETFCRDCHAGSGLASGAGMNAAFHTGQPMWVLSHGQAARQGMEACASCHRQQDCMQCHSAAGGWGVSPHGRGFAASRAAARSGASCRLCHLSPPGGQ
jgi:predicted CXXCH cytochrome family protein